MRASLHVTHCVTQAGLQLVTLCFSLLTAGIIHIPSSLSLSSFETDSYIAEPDLELLIFLTQY